MPRWSAFAIHLAASLLVGLAVWVVLSRLWFPGPYFAAEGASTLAAIIIGVDVSIGPLLTLIVFKSGKPGLKRDLAIIIVLQVAALLYGLDIMRQTRPVFIVATVDRLVMTYASEYSAKDLGEARAAEFSHLSWTGPLLVAAVPPSDPQKRHDLALGALSGGKQLQHLPRHFIPYAQQSMGLLIHSRPVEELAQQSEQHRLALQRMADSAGLQMGDLWHLPVQLRRGSLRLVVSGRDGSPLGPLAMPD